MSDINMTDFSERFRELGVPDNPAFPANDIGASSLFGSICGDTLRYVVEQKSWYWYTGQTWKQDIGSLKAMERCKAFADAYGSYICSSCEDEKAQNFATKLTSRRRRETILADARSIAPIGLDTFDRNRMLLNCRNGTFNLHDMTFHNHSPGDYVTKTTRARYDPKARCQRWERFIDEVMCGDADTARYLQTVLGYSCTGDTSLEKMWLLYGPSTRNGKSTTVETVAYLLGDYAKTASAATISHRSADGTKASPDIARLMGTRLVNINEPDRNLILNAAVVKQLTGGDTLVARFLNENLFEFMPEGKFFVNTNHLPQIVDTTVFTSGRVVIIPFERHFAEQEQDRGLKRYLRRPGNLSGILNWLIEGYRMFRSDGLRPSARIKAAIAEYAVESDVLGLFLGEAVVPAENGRLSTAALYSVYTAWLKARGSRPIRVQGFVGELRKRYDVTHDRRIGNVIVGAALAK